MSYSLIVAENLTHFLNPWEVANMKTGLNRRAFLRNAGLAAASTIIGCSKVVPEIAALTKKNNIGDSTTTSTITDNSDISLLNKLPKWKGFNIPDYFQPDPEYVGGNTPEEFFKWVADWGFDFIRMPVAYPTYLNIKAHQKYINADDVYKIDESKANQIEKTIYLAQKYGLHVSLNLHRAPGFCVSNGYHEPYNLWKQKDAQDAFNYHWSFWAKRFKNVSTQKISFDLVNEPCYREDVNDTNSKTTAVPGATYRAVAQAAALAIRKENPKFYVIADGNMGGTDPVSELIDLNIAQSCRGYVPYEISHYKAPWVFPDPAYQPKPVWPGDMGGNYYSKATMEEYYKPWIDLAKKGVGVHCGECGCWKETPHNVFLAWFGDVLDILASNGIGFALWELKGDFGLLNSNRSDIQYENWYGYKLDRKLLTMLQSK
ncbi:MULTISPECIES: glycoside hydrolase family 5 protein [Niastella]|uniref:Cellulase family glycosylhydrolase n=1 Tax=Niastella soli TaxID=2821487 RepID=A0ABS3YN75_9BACT|nr:cellulase family glycosylhydrolase [Niastella soli]MBO9199299.1 cellulase family glycosylhydrolase [Niastella soli]